VCRPSQSNTRQKAKQSQGEPDEVARSRSDLSEQHVVPARSNREKLVGDAGGRGRRNQCLHGVAR
jgi:hypothetical protein